MRRIKEAIEREDEEIMEFITEEMKALAQRLEERGMEKGRVEGLFQSALNFLKMGLSVEDVARGTGLPKEKIMELKASF